MSLALLLLTSVFALPLQSQDPPRKKKLTELTLEELMELEVQVVYAASGYLQKVADAPAQVTILTADDVRKHGWRTLADVLRSVRGFHVTYDRNYSYLGVRGFGLPSDYNSRTLFTIDGHRANENIFDGTLFGHEFPIDLDLVDRIEVVRGPGSSLYGSNAFFGVVNVMTRRGRQLDGVEVSGSLGDGNERRGRVSYGKKFDDGLEVLVSGSAYGREGETLHFDEFDAPATNNGHVEDADWEKAASFFAQASYGHVTLQGAYVSRTKGIPTGSFGTAFPSDETWTRDERAYLDLRYERRYDGGTGVLARTSVDGYWYRGDYEYEDPSTGSRYTNRDQVAGVWWGAELKATQDLWSDRLRLTAGGEFRDNVRQDQKNFDAVSPKVVYLDSRERTYVAAGYAQADAALTEDVRVNGGIRCDSYETFGASWNPRAALLVSPFAETVVKLLYGRAFRAPSAYELFYEDNGVLQKSNPDLEPETVDSLELVVEHAFDDRVSASLGGFVYDVDGLIAQRLDPADGLLFFDNVGEVRTVGGEAELRARLSEQLRGSLSYTYQEARDDETDSWLPNSPRSLAKLNLTAPVAAETLFAGLELQYVGKRRTLAGGKTDDFVLANFTLFARELAKGLEFSASVYNLFDVEYADPASTEHPQDAIGQDGLGFRIKLTYRF